MYRRLVECPRPGSTRSPNRLVVIQRRLGHTREASRADRSCLRLLVRCNSTPRELEQVVGVSLEGHVLAASLTGGQDAQGLFRPDGGSGDSSPRRAADPNGRSLCHLPAFVRPPGPEDIAVRRHPEGDHQTRECSTGTPSSTMPGSWKQSLRAPRSDCATALTAFERLERRLEPPKHAASRQGLDKRRPRTCATRRVQVAPPHRQDYRDPVQPLLLDMIGREPAGLPALLDACPSAPSAAGAH